jgi:hypothetical protein
LILVYTVETSHNVTARLGFLAHEYGWGALGFSGNLQSNLGENRKI